MREIARGSGVPRRRSRGSCAATRRRGAASWSTGRRWRSGTRERPRSRPKVAKLPRNDAAARVRAGPARRADRRRRRRARRRARTCAWIGRRHGRRQDRRWATAWSPEQIANRLRIDFPDDESMRVCHEAIYQALYIQGRGALRRELVACLRTGRALRVPRARTRRRRAAFVTAEVMISERPAEVEDRAVPGPLGRRSDHRARELRDRHPRRAHHPVHDAAAPAAAWRPRRRPARQERARRWPATVPRPSATRSPPRSHAARAAAPVADLGPGRGDGPARPAQDRHRHRRSTSATRTAPGSAARNENTNGLLRQYFPKGTDLSRCTADDLEAVAADTQQPTPQDPRLAHPRRGLSNMMKRK